MKNIESNPHSENKPIGSRLHRLLALAAIGIGGAASYYYGSSSRDQEVQDLAATSAEKDERLEQIEHQLEQSKRAIKRVTKHCREQQRRVLVGEDLKETANEAQCIDVVDRALRERTYELAALLGMTNSNDINTLMDVMRRGYTKIDSIDGDGSSMTLKDPNAEKDSLYTHRSITLEEPIEHIPDEFLSHFDKVEKSDEELALEQKISDGDIEDVVTKYDLEKFRPLEEDPDSEEIKGHEALVDMQARLAETDDPNEQLDMFCEVFAAWARMAIEDMEEEKAREQAGEELEIDEDADESDIELSSDGVQRMRLEQMYMKALMRYLGIEDEEECLIRAIAYPPECPPCEPCDLEYDQEE